MQMIHKSYPILGSCSTETQNPNALRLMRVICQLRMSAPYNFVKEYSNGKKSLEYSKEVLNNKIG